MIKSKIGIVTVYNSYNYGSILQAKALLQYINMFGTGVLVKTKARNSFKQGLKEIIRGIQSHNRKRINFEIKRFLFFRRLEKQLSIVSANKANKTCKMFVFGSDEIWNISRKCFRQFPIFWGDGLNGNKVAYAPSINNTTGEDLENGKWKLYLDQFDALSVRDNYSRNVLSKMTTLPISVVVDPTMLMKLDYGSFSPFDKGYVALYISDNKFDQPKSAIELISKFAKENSKKTVSLGLWSNWADSNYVDKKIPPFYYYRDADYVITNTFHGTVFAILFKKQFVSFASKNKKVYELMDSVGLAHRIVSEKMSFNDFDCVLKNQIDYSAVDSRISDMREYSGNYLKSLINSVFKQA